MRFLTFFLLSLCALPAYAQVNAEVFRGDLAGSNGWSTTFGTDLRLAYGNVDLKSYAVDARADYSTDDSRAFILGDVFKGESNGKVFDDRGFVHARALQNIYQAFKAQIDGEIFAQGQYDTRKDLNLRQLYGTGLRYEYYIFRVAFAVGAGAMYELERLKDPSQNVGAVWRSTNYLSVIYLRDFFKDYTKAVLTAYYQPLYSDPSDYRLKVDLSMLANFSLSWIKVGPTLTYAYDSRPPIGVRRQDVVLGFKLNLSFKGGFKNPRTKE